MPRGRGRGQRRGQEPEQEPGQKPGQNYIKSQGQDHGERLYLLGLHYYYLDNYWFYLATY